VETIDFDRINLEGARVLDVGCGDGRHSHAAALEGASTVVGIDINRARLETARENGRELSERSTTAADTGYLRGDATSLPFPDDSFDVVVCSEVLEHLPAYETALDEIGRVARPDATLAISVPRYGPERVCWALSDEYHEVEGGHVRIFERRALQAAVEARGFDRIDGHFAHALHAPYWWLKCLWWDRDERGDPPPPLRAYDRFLEWDVLNDPAPVRLLERALDPLVGKSVVMYFENETGA